MARFREFDLEFSLFPFLSIMLCLIGTLSLINVCLILNRQMTLDRELILIDDPVEKYVEIINQIEQISPQLDELKNKIEQSIALKNRLEALQVELNFLKSSHIDTVNTKNEFRQLLEKTEKLRKKIILNENEKKNLLDRISHQEKINNQMDKKETSPKNIVILPSSKETNNEPRIPFFIECSGSEIILHPSLAQIPVDEIRININLKQFINKIVNEEHAILVIMIRPNGAKTNNILVPFIEDRKIPYGQIPLPGFGKIDFGQFHSPNQ